MQTIIEAKEEYTKTIVEFVERKGYVVHRIHVDGFFLFDITPSDYAGFHPGIVHNFQSGKWAMQTVSHGALTEDKIEQFLNAYRNAQTVVEFLNTVNIDNLTNYRPN